MNRNPNAPKDALTFSDIKPGVEVVVICGGLYFHERIKITSKPYIIKYEIANPAKPGGDLIEVESYVVKAKSLGVATGTEVSRRGQGSSSKESEYHLATMGLSTDHKGHWSLNYTVRASDYRADDH